MRITILRKFPPGEHPLSIYAQIWWLLDTPSPCKLLNNRITSWKQYVYTFALTPYLSLRAYVLYGWSPEMCPKQECPLRNISPAKLNFSYQIIIPFFPTHTYEIEMQFLVKMLAGTRLKWRKNQAEWNSTKLSFIKVILEWFIMILDTHMKLLKLWVR